MSLLDGEQKPVLIHPSNHKARQDVFEADFYLDAFREFTNAKVTTEAETGIAGGY